MQKLIIADDERIIRETIFHLIDWKSLNIEVVGLCKDGIEAYNMILDESPDIVMTDIRMPGLSGLELVKRTAQTNKEIQFIIISGYEEFEYARTAMKYGVKYYLLKPCSEGKIIESIQEASEDSRKAKMLAEKQLQQNKMLHIIHQDAMYHLILEGIYMYDHDDDKMSAALEEQIRLYGQYLDSKRKDCYLYYIYFLEEKNLDQYLNELEEYSKKQNQIIVFYGTYVKNTLLLFCYEELKGDILCKIAEEKSLQLEIKKEMYPGLLSLMRNVLHKIRRYDVIYAIHNFRAIPILNNRSSFQYMQDIYNRLETGDRNTAEACIEELAAMVKEATRPESLHMIGNSICTHMSKIGAYSVTEEAGFLKKSNQEKDVETLRTMILDMLDYAQKELQKGNQKYGILVERVMEYTEEHISDSELTLKKISEEFLYMNVDYVSRKFHKTTGKKFSQYLTECRVEKGKELLLDGEDKKIQYVAQMVGCGNNPQYFSQIFKRITGVTPGQWLVQMKSK